MNKCKYCENKSEWINPYTNAHMCEYHAIEKLNQLIEEFNLDDMTLKDFFRRDRDDDRKDFFSDESWSIKENKIIK